jgi:hypothetical protein
MKTSELSGHLLDYYVGKALGKNVKIIKHQREEEWFCVENTWPTIYLSDCFVNIKQVPFNPSTNWDLLGPLLDKKKIDLSSGLHTASLPKEVDIWVAMKDGVKYDACGDTPLIAVCRLIVWMEYGDSVPDMDDQGNIVHACLCGSWPGGQCLNCKRIEEGEKE